MALMTPVANLDHTGSNHLRRSIPRLEPEMILRIPFGDKVPRNLVESKKSS